MPDPVGIVRRRGDGVVSRTKITSKSIRDSHRIARCHGAEMDIFELGIRAVDVEADASADEDSDYRICYFAGEADGDADGDRFSAAKDYRGHAVGAEKFNSGELGAAIAIA